jgi:hypothetical protein
MLFEAVVDRGGDEPVEELRDQLLEPQTIERSVL